jgi:5-methylthioadenosine/S-adenosylhomocysteine deaminase
LLVETSILFLYNADLSAKLGNKVTRIQNILKAGINIGLGVNTYEYYNLIDIFEKMKITSDM